MCTWQSACPSGSSRLFFPISLCFCSCGFRMALKRLGRWGSAIGSGSCQDSLSVLDPGNYFLVPRQRKAADGILSLLASAQHVRHRLIWRAGRASQTKTVHIHGDGVQLLSSLCFRILNNFDTVPSMDVVFLFYKTHDLVIR